MLDLTNYEINKTIFSGSNSIIYGGLRQSDKEKVTIKVLKSENPTYEAIAKLKFEFEITKKLSIDGVIKALALEKHKGGYAIIMEHVAGESLASVIQKQQLSLTSALTIAISLADTLGKIHGYNIIHKDINPNNIVVDMDKAKVYIIDFGISTELTQESAVVNKPDFMEGSLPYLSPEQTGRMNRPIDYRTDYYSFGITLYQLITGQLPFNHIDSLELMHAHIAKLPTPPEAVNPKIPKAVSDIVMKLMAKTAEQRYQSALGLIHDLETCLKQLQDNNTITPFTLGAKDTSGKFQILPKLYGREQEIDLIMSLYHTVSEGNSALLNISGYSGIGKTALVNEIHKPILSNNGYFISGKFNQFQKNIPYQALIQAFQDLISQLLTESQVHINTWKEKLLSVLGHNGQVITNIIPELEFIIGKQPALIELGPVESKNRFNIVFQNFTKVFTQKEHPLVLFLDDMQWADSSSLELIRSLLADNTTKHLLFISAYRSNEVDIAHPLLAFIEEVKKADTAVKNISLNPLPLKIVNNMLCDSLKCDAAHAAPLTQIVHDKTSGNPFFVSEFLKYLNDEKLIVFNATLGVWAWQLDSIKNATIPDNVVELLLDKIKKLPIATQEALKYAAAIGNRFDLRTLATVSQKSENSVNTELQDAVSDGLIMPIGDDYKLLQLNDTEAGLNQTLISYRFMHDRVQQASYALIREKEKQALHLQIGRLLLQKYKSAEREQKVFDILNHLNTAEPLITEQQERLEVATLNLLAGNKAKISAAYEPATKYLKLGLDFLPASNWEQHYNLTLSLYESLAEAYYLNSQYEPSQTTADEALRHVKAVLDRTQLYETKIQAYVAKGEPLKAIDVSCEALKALGISIPKSPKVPHIILGLIKTKMTLGKKKAADLGKLPVLTDPHKHAAMQILRSSFFPAYLAMPNLFPILTFEVVKICVKYGNSRFSPFAYSIYGILSASLGSFQDCEDYGALSVKLLEETQATEIKCSTLQNMVVGGLTHTKPFNEAIRAAEVSMQTGLDTGDVLFLGLASFHYCALRFINAELLETTIAEMVKYAYMTKKMEQIRFHPLSFFLDTALRLSDKGLEQADGLLNDFNEQRSLDVLTKANSFSEVSASHIGKAIGHYFFKEYESANEQIKLAGKYEQNLQGSFYFNEYVFYHSLIQIALFKKTAIGKVKSYQKKAKTWAKFAPANYQSRYELVEAELARLKGDTATAKKYYEQAIKTATANNNLYVEALANELYAEFYLAQQDEQQAATYLMDARKNYTMWGAIGKVKQLDAQYPALMAKTAGKATKLSRNTTISSTSTKSSSDIIDLSSILKFSSALAQELNMDKVLEAVMKILIENAGAERGMLILQQKGKLYVEASGSINDKDVKVLSIPVEESDNLPLSVINYVARTQKELVFDNASVAEAYAKDPYIKAKQPKSVLCFPVLNKGELSNIIYLENNLAEGAFTANRLELLKMLSSQIAISIDNAQLYENLEEKVKERTAEIERQKHLVEEKNQDIMASIQYAKRLQDAILPPAKFVKDLLPESFILFKPKDIVSGDFYWIERKANKVFFAAVDCTGHGVPGALVSIVGHNGLSRAINEFGLTEPAAILDKLNELVSETFRQREDKQEVKDGMDIALCALDVKAKTLEYSGANNPLWLIRNGELLETKADKQPIGAYDNRHPFVNHTMALMENDAIYVFSDGFADQFGGPKGKKFMYRPFKELLIQNQNITMEAQKILLGETIDAWRGDLEQIDDMCVIGVRV